MEGFSFNQFRICQLINTNLGQPHVQALCNFEKRVIFGRDITKLCLGKINAFLMKTIRSSPKEIAISGQQKERCIIFVRVSAFVKSERGVCLFEAFEVFFVTPKRLIVKSKDNFDPLHEVSAIGKQFDYSFGIGDNPCFNSFFEPRALISSAAFVYELRAELAIDILGGVFEISNIHISSCNPGIKKQSKKISCPARAKYLALLIPLAFFHPAVKKLENCLFHALRSIGLGKVPFHLIHGQRKVPVFGFLLLHHYLEHRVISKIAFF